MSGVSRETALCLSPELRRKSASVALPQRTKDPSVRDSFVTTHIARGGACVGYFTDDGQVPTPRRREGSGSRATPQLAEDRPPIHEPPLRRDRGGHHSPRRGDIRPL